MKRILGILFGLISIVMYLKGQELIKNDNEILFVDFADSLEFKYQVRLFYSSDWAENIYVTPYFGEQSIGKAIEKSLEGVAKYIFTSDSNLIIIKDYVIHKDYFRSYSQSSRNADQSEKTDSNYPLEISESNNVALEYKKIVFGSPSDKVAGKEILITGKVTNRNSGETMIGAVVYNARDQKGAVCNENGDYKIKVSSGEQTIEFRAMGMRTTKRQIEAYSDGVLNIEMDEEIEALEEVVVIADKQNAVNSMSMGVSWIDAKMLKKIPMGMGEADVIKSSLLLPGVQSAGEASSGFNVRGGSTDQNLILFNKAPIMNTSHFFGFFSAFNSDLIEDVSLYKSCPPAKLGGRISSIMEIESKEGNQEKIKLIGGISPVSVRISLEGPIVKDKVSFTVGMRSTYSDYLLKYLSDYKLKNSNASFYDVQATLNAKINNRNSFFLSVYTSRDLFNYYQETSYTYENLVASTGLRHTFNENLMGEISLITSSYTYNIQDVESTNSSLSYNIDQKIARLDFNYFPNSFHSVDFGLEGTFYNLMPGHRKPIGSSTVIEKKLQDEEAMQYTIYVSDKLDVTPLLGIEGGIRLNWFGIYGPRTTNSYLPGESRSVATIQEQTEFLDNQLVKNYISPEFRFLARYKTSLNSSVKIGVTQMVQHIHMISNTTSISPTDIWKLSDSYIKPQKSLQFSGGFYQNILQNKVEASVEVYYKKTKNIIDYKGGAELIMNDHLETELLSGKGKAYGVEFMLKKTKGKLNGWISYAYARSFHKIDGDDITEKVNNGEYFPSNYDKPHDFKLVSNYKFSRRINLTSNIVYNTGRPITYPVAYFDYNSNSRVYFSDRNEYRIPDYFRVDFALTVNGNLKKNKLNHSSFTFAVYNAFGRKNPYSIYFKTENNQIKAYKMSIFGQPIVTLTYNFKFNGNAQDD